MLIQWGFGSETLTKFTVIWWAASFLKRRDESAEQEDSGGRSGGSTELFANTYSPKQETNASPYRTLLLFFFYQVHNILLHRERHSVMELCYQLSESCLRGEWVAKLVHELYTFPIGYRKSSEQHPSPLDVWRTVHSTVPIPHTA